MRQLDQEPPRYVYHPPTTANLKNSSITQIAESTESLRAIFLTGLTVCSPPGTVSGSSQVDISST